MPATTPCARSPSAWDAPLPCDTSPRLIPIWCFEPWRRGGPIPFARSSCRRPIRCSPTATPRACKGLLAALDLLVVLEYRLTPTAQLADYVLPIAGALERPVLQVHGGIANAAYGGPAAVAPYYERRCDYDVFRELGRRLGQAEFWPEETLEDAFASQLLPAGLSWEEFCIEGTYWPRPAYAKHEALGADGRPVGFATTTGRIELGKRVSAFPRRQPPAPCLGRRLLAAPSRSSPALADSRIMLPCTSRIRAFAMGRQHRRQR